MPWGVQYPADHSTYPHHVHPSQIYDSLLGLGLYLGLAWLYRRKKFDGQVFAGYLLCYAITRSIVETFRGDYPKHYLGGIATPAHLVSIAIFAAGAVLYWRLSQSGPPRKPAEQRSAAR